MSKENYTAPEFGKTAFHCPMCNVYAEQRWDYAWYRNTKQEISNLTCSTCSYCKKICLWMYGELIYPLNITAPLAHSDMPESVLEYYNEARPVSAFSPRAAAALLRIAAKKLCEKLGEDESNLNRAIGNLKKKGLPESVINSLDTVRIVGNEGGAHEGQIDLTGEDNKEVVDKLFRLINFIVEKTITEPEEVQNMFAALPKDKKAATEKRDERK